MDAEVYPVPGWIISTRFNSPLIISARALAPVPSPSIFTVGVDVYSRPEVMMSTLSTPVNDCKTSSIKQLRSTPDESKYLNAGEELMR